MVHTLTKKKKEEEIEEIKEAWNLERKRVEDNVIF
jgi:predicted lipid-binding transport protein (Tim44 family)